MKLQKSDSIMNLGDTSFRRARLLDDYRIMLPLLVDSIAAFGSWGDKNDSQSYFYRLVAQSGLIQRDFLDDFIKLEKNEDVDNLKIKYQSTLQKRFKVKYSTSSDIPNEELLRYFLDEQKKRGRTYSSALYKIGLVDSKRRLTSIGRSFINQCIHLDNIEVLLQLDCSNILFLRQLLKLRVYDPNGKNYYYPGRVAFYLLSKYDSVVGDDFAKIITLIRPTMSLDKVKGIIDDYNEVLVGNKTSGEYFGNHFPDNSQQDSINKFYEEGANTLEEFKLYFVNRKTPASVKDYYQLYLTIIEFNRTPSEDVMAKLVKLGKLDSVKKAFGYRKSLFEFKRNDSIADFKERNEETNLLVEDIQQFRRNFYSTFADSKRYDLIYEYRDMTMRTLNLCGLISFDKNIVRLGQKWVTKDIFASHTFANSLSGIEAIELYEEDDKSPFYSDLTTLEILNISEQECDTLINKIRITNNIPMENNISTYFEEKFYQDFLEKINERFSDHDIVEILLLFVGRLNDEEIFRRVTDQTSIPTIFEYILAIAWHRISNQSYNLFNSLNLTLDANFYPVSHAPGGDGDIVISDGECNVMLEATLMDKNAQKRGELEPVIRHTANLAIREKSKNTFTIFVADELDNNVINIFRAVYYTELESTQKRGETVDGVKIFALSISELVKIMRRGVDAQKILLSITNHYDTPLNFIHSGWRREILDRIFV